MVKEAALILVALSVLGYAGAPLVPTAHNTPDLCCTATGLCPGGMMCLIDDTCGPDSLGYCVPIITRVE